jgi:2-polyprenyl-3-methyl-5-hydroxy-6-metoxy-1,4-benzoquinol methylase
MPDVAWNDSYWSKQYLWTDGGEEWSQAWRGSEAQWYGSLLPRLHSFLPVQSILEIAPGRGRWTQYLLPSCNRYLGIDLSDECTSFCRRRFEDIGKASFVRNDGYSLNAAEDNSFDLIFSFDSLVHAEFDVIEHYIRQIVKKLQKNGAAFIHHSNLLEYANFPRTPHEGRGRTVSASVVANTIESAGGRIIVQEVVNWGHNELIDCFTLFGRADRGLERPPIFLRNPHYMDEAKIIAAFQSHYAVQNLYRT